MNDFSHVLWIGGPSGSGKTTAARRLARRHGLRWYNSDAHTWKHRDRALAAGVPAAARFELWRATDPRPAVSSEESLAMGLHVERGPMTLDDIRALPSAPLIVAEGTPITPHAVGVGPNAIWLFLPWQVRRERLRARGVESGVREPLMARLLTAEVAETGARRVDIDPDASVDDTVALLEKLFADRLAAGPVARSTAERRALLRSANRIIVEQYQGFFARPWADKRRGDPLTFDCECGDPACTATVAMPADDFPPPPDDATSPPVLAHA